MDDQDRAPALARAALVGSGALVLLVAARSALGDLAAHGVLLLVLVALLVFAYGQLTGRPLPRLGRPAQREVAAPPVVEDVWRSERWITEAVARGLRALDEWRLEQRGA